MTMRRSTSSRSPRKNLRHRSSLRSGPLLVDDKSDVAPVPAEDEEIIKSVISGKTPSYVLESRLGDCRRAAGVRREAVKRFMKRNFERLPLIGFDYDSI